MRRLPLGRRPTKLPFNWKLGIVVTSFSVLITGICVYAFYVVSLEAITRQIGKNLLHVGRIGALMFDEEAREAIKRLTAATQKDSIVSAKEIAAMQSPSNLLSLRQEDIVRYHSSKDFQLLLDVLSVISLVTQQDMEPKKTHYRIAEPMRMFSNGGFGAYLVVAINESPNHKVMKYLASNGPEPTPDGWPGNPIGNLTKGYEAPEYVFHGKPYVDDKLYTDKYYTSLSAFIPILDKDGTFLAILGVDFVTNELKNTLTALKIFCVGLVLFSLLLSVVSSYYMSRKLTVSLGTLSEAAERVTENDFSVALDIKTKDEFAFLGKVFNDMVASIRKYMENLGEKHNQLATVAFDMHDGVGAILTSIAMTSEKEIVKGKQELQGTLDRYVSINHLAREGLTEVRFLMNALDYEQCDYATVIDEIQVQGADILSPSGVRFDLKILGDIPQGRLEFKSFLGLQRIFREFFSNVVNHSDATICSVSMEFRDDDIAITIFDNGSETRTRWRSLKSLLDKIKQLDGTLKMNSENGFFISLSIPDPAYLHEKQKSKASI